MPTWPIFISGLSVPVFCLKIEVLIFLFASLVLRDVGLDNLVDWLHNFEHLYRPHVRTNGFFIFQQD